MRMANLAVESRDATTLIEEIVKAVHLVEDKMLHAGLDKAIYHISNKRGA
jgi:hypothetical protein